jgi:hypothetical protein
MTTQTITIEQVLQFINTNMDYETLHNINQAAFHRCKAVKEYRSKQAVRALGVGDVVKFKSGRTGQEETIKLTKINRLKVIGKPCDAEGIITDKFHPGWIIPAAVCTMVKHA